VGEVLLSVEVPGKPVGFKRPRFNGKRGFNDPGYARWKRMAAQLFALKYQGQPLDKPVCVQVDAVFVRPKCWVPRPDGTMTRAKHAELRALVGDERFRVPAMRERTDVDNVAKAALDALQDAGVIVDDCRVVDLVARKWWCALHRDQPMVHVRVQEWSA